MERVCYKHGGWVLSLSPRERAQARHLWSFDESCARTGVERFAALRLHGPDSVAAGGEPGRGWGARRSCERRKKPTAKERRWKMPLSGVWNVVNVVGRWPATGALSWPSTPRGTVGRPRTFRLPFGCAL
eukprot:COSAG04_NODE_15053_length_545_cov_1.692825_1_plen_128_part_10